MITPDHDIGVNYYRVREGTELYQAITDYHALCVDFVQRAEALVRKYKADSAVRLCDFFNMRVSGLNFTDQNAPLRWNMDGFGYFRPKPRSEAAKDFNIEMPRVERFHRWPDGVRFGNLGDALVISVTPNKDGSVCAIQDADLLDEAGFERLKQNAPDEDVEYIRSLGRYYWTAAPLLRTTVFTPSDEVERLNDERFNFCRDWRLELKHSFTGRVVRRALGNLGLHWG